MARKKAASASAEPMRRETILSLKGTTHWSAWLDRLAIKSRTTKAGVIDRALAEYAARIEFEEPPQR